MGKKSKKAPAGAKAPGAAKATVESVEEAFAGLALERGWPRSILDIDKDDDAAHRALMDAYEADRADLYKQHLARWKKLRVRDRPKGLLSFRRIRVTEPLIDVCDFVALLEFEDRHPELYATADEIPPHRDDVRDPRYALRQLDAFHRIWDDPRYHKEFFELVQPMREERREARRRGDDENRFLLIDSPGHCIKGRTARGAFDEIQDRFHATPDAPAVVCSCCARTEWDPRCEKITWAKRDITLPWRGAENPEEGGNSAIVICRAAQQAITLAAKGKSPRFKMDDGSRATTCAKCGIHSSESPREHSVCSRCRKVYYCSKECQRAAWPKHKPHCRVPD